MLDDIPDWAAILIGGGVGLLLIGLLLLSIEGVSNAKRKRDAKRQTENEDQISFDLPSGEYDTTGRLFPSELQEEVEADAVEIQTKQIPENLQKKLDMQRERRSKKKGYGVRH